MDKKPLIISGPDVSLALALRAGREGVAYSQLSMGKWTPEFYAERCKIIREKFQRDLERFSKDRSDDGGWD
jgi:hypothetical protein